MENRTSRAKQVGVAHKCSPVCLAGSDSLAQGYRHRRVKVQPKLDPKIPSFVRDNEMLSTAEILSKLGEGSIVL